MLFDVNYSTFLHLVSTHSGHMLFLNNSSSADTQYPVYFDTAQNVTKVPEMAKLIRRKTGWGTFRDIQADRKLSQRVGKRVLKMQEVYYDFNHENNIRQALIY